MNKMMLSHRKKKNEKKNETLVIIDIIWSIGITFAKQKQNKKSFKKGNKIREQ